MSGVDAVVVLAEVLLAGCFGVAGLAKLRTGGASIADLRALGITAPLAVRALRRLPTLELIVAALVAWPLTARVGASLACVLLTCFTAILVAAMQAGRKVSCHCFGSTSERPVDGWTLLRNVVLVAAAVLLIVAPPTLASSSQRWLVVAGAVILTQAALLHSELRAPVHVIPTRVAALLDEEGTATQVARPLLIQSLDSRGLADRPVVAVFVDPHCGPCSRLLAEVAGSPPVEVGSRTVVLVTSGPLVEDVVLAQAVDAMVSDPNGDLATESRIPGTPAAVIVSASGMAIGEPALGLDAVRDLLYPHRRRFPISSEAPSAPPVGVAATIQRTEVRAPRATAQSPLSSLTAHAMDVPSSLGRHYETGLPVPAADPAGRWTVVLHSGQGCVDCPDLAAAARSRQVETRHRLVILGTVEDSDPDLVVDDGRGFAQAVGLDSGPAIVVLDEGGRPLAAPAFGTASALATLEVLAK